MTIIFTVIGQKLVKIGKIVIFWFATVIFFSAWDESHDLTANSLLIEQM